MQNHDVLTSSFLLHLLLGILLKGELSFLIHLFIYLYHYGLIYAFLPHEHCFVTIFILMLILALMSF